MKTVYFSIFALVLVLMSGAPLMSGGSAYARYVSTKTQSQTNINNCSNDSNCAITSPQSQGDGSASSPTNVQISGFNTEQQGVGEEPNPGAKGFLEVQKIVKCPSGFVCPEPDRFIMHIEVTGGVSGLGWNPHDCRGVSPPAICQVVINLQAGQSANYVVTETVAPDVPGLTLLKIPSAGCQGTISQTQRINCTFTNQYRTPEELKAEVLVKMHAICPTGFQCPPANRFLIRAEANGATVNPMDAFEGSETGTKVSFDIDPDSTTAAYTFRVGIPVVPGLVPFLSSTGDCAGSLQGKDSKLCTFTTEYHPGMLSRLYVKNRVICPTGFSCPSPDKFTMNVDASGTGSIYWSPKSFPGSSQGTNVLFALPGTINIKVTEVNPPTPTGLKLTVSQDMGCTELPPRKGQTCTTTNEYSIR